MTRSVVLAGYQGVQALDVSGPFDVFSTATLLTAADGAAEPAYDVSLVSSGGTAVTTGTGLDFVARPLPDPTTPIDTLILPGGLGSFAIGDDDPELVTWIRAAAPTIRRIATVCTGAFIAAEAGLLDDCRATTHWAFAELLAQRYPAIDVDAEPIFLQSSAQVWTAAGVTSGVDLALALVEHDHGTDLAQRVARWLVLYMRRPGGQSQFAPPVWSPRGKRRPIRAVQEAIEADPGASHTITDLASLASMSPRHFTRVFTADIGEAPSSYVERIRVDAARRFLEQTDDTMPTIADRCGFGSAESMRRIFSRRLGVSPTHYRKTFH